MRKILGLAVAASALFLAAPMSAFAFGDECHKPVTGKGKEKEDSMRSAYKEAIEAWEKAAEKKYKEDFSWSYSGDRSISCKWKTGKDILCSATAIPCERD